MTDTSERDLIALPKAHLHVHLAQAMRLATLNDWAEADGVVPPRVGSFPDFGAFLNASSTVVGLLRSRERVRRLIDEAVEDAKHEGVAVLELSFSPALYASIFGSAESALEHMTEWAEESGLRHGVWAAFIIGIERHKGPEQADATSVLAARFAGRGVVGLGLYGDERAYSAYDFRRAFASAKDHGLLSVPHAGELLGPGSIRDAIDALQADRIQHGVTAIHDAELLDELAERGICLDVCPTSNLLLGVVGDLADHPLDGLLEAGVRCSINADDPTLFGRSIVTEYELCRTTMGLDDGLLATCATSSVEASAAPTSIKERAASEIDRWRLRP